MSFQLDSISRKVGAETYLSDISLEFKKGSTNVVLGHTLAGKTSLLRIMAGLDKPTYGRILVDGEDVTGISVRKRSIAMVYQQFINYPSLNIYDNIASPLKMKNMAPEEIDQRVRETAAMLHIEDLLDRLPSELSGGQQQRTAIARSLVKESDLLLLDEPLVNLDYKLREELQVELQDIFQKREAIVVYTTTEPTEALMLGGNIVIIDEGRVLQTGPTPEVYRNPVSTRVAQVFSDPPINYLNGTAREGSALLDQDIEIPLVGHLKTLKSGDYTFGIRPNHFSLSRDSKNDVEIQVKVALAEISGSETFIHVLHGDSKLVVQEDGIKPFHIDSEIAVYINPSNFFVFDEQGKLFASQYLN